VLLPRGVFEHRLKAVIHREEPAPRKIIATHKRELEQKLADLLARWPAHSVPLSMWQQREELEEELERLQKETEKAEDAG
jgi:hypothetical protein